MWIWHKIREGKKWEMEDNRRRSGMKGEVRGNEKVRGGQLFIIAEVVE